MEMVLDQVCASCGSKRLPYGRFCLNGGDLLADSEAKASSTLSTSSSMPGAMSADDPELAITQVSGCAHGLEPLT